MLKKIGLSFLWIALFSVVACSSSTSSSGEQTPLLDDPYADAAVSVSSVDDFDLLVVEKNSAKILGVTLSDQSATTLVNFDSDTTDATLSGLNGLVLDSDNQIFVVDSLIGAVAQIDLSDQSAEILYVGPSGYKTSGVDTPDPAYAIKTGDSSGTLWVFADDTLLEINTATGDYDEIFTFEDDRAIKDFAVSGDFIYAADSESDELIKIDSSTGAVTVVAAFGEDSGDETAYETLTSLSLSADESLAYVTLRSVSSSVTVVVAVDLTDGSTEQIATLDAGMFCLDIETTADDETAYVSCSDGKLYEVALESGIASVILEDLDFPDGIVILN